MPVTLFSDIVRRLKNEPVSRIVAFGSSNTEMGQHSEGAHNWFDWLDVGIQSNYGRVHHSINSGVCGQTTQDMLARFERDVALYQPHVVIVTAGGNDSNHCESEKRISLDSYKDNLKTIVDKIRKLGAIAVLQTYYSVDFANIPVDARPQAMTFVDYMNAVVLLSQELGCHLLDNFGRWEQLRARNLPKYRSLMRDNWHVNAQGNMLWGLDIMRYFGGGINDEKLRNICAGGFDDLRLLDSLNN